MIFHNSIRVLFGLVLSVMLSAQDGIEKTKPTPPRVFFHSRGASTGHPFIETWKKGDTTYYFDETIRKLYDFSHESIKESNLKSPVIDSKWKGYLKFRNGIWWFLQPEKGVRPEDRISLLRRYDPVSKTWNILRQLSVRVSNFEIIDNNRFILFGLFDPTQKKYFLAGLMSENSSSIDFLDEAPIKYQFPELFWKTCITSIDDSMAYAYFPLSGHVYGYDLDSYSLKEFKLPWSPLSDDSIAKEIKAAQSAGKKDCFISAVTHPGASNCYFLPLPGGQMGFVYKVIDEEEEQRRVFPDGTRPIIERVAYIIMIPDDPHLLLEMTTPTQMFLERWCWSKVAGKLVRWEDRMVAEKPDPSQHRVGKNSSGQ